MNSGTKSWEVKHIHSTTVHAKKVRPYLTQAKPSNRESVGVELLEDHPIEEVMEYIDWTPFFQDDHAMCAEVFC